MLKHTPIRSRSSAYLVLVVATFATIPRGAGALDPGDFLVADSGVFLRALLQVDPHTGDRTIFSSASVGGGPAFSTPFDLAIEADGSILVSDFHLAAIFRVDPATGDRTIVSSAAIGSGRALVRPSGITIEQGGSILVCSVEAVIRIDPVTGDRSVVSSHTVGTGPVFSVNR
jgi:streptogramin lyase